MLVRESTAVAVRDLMLDVFCLRREHHEVIRMVVPPVAVDVMNNLTGEQCPPEFSFSLNSMDGLSSDLRVPGAAPCFKGPAASEGAVDGVLGRSRGEIFLALRTSLFDALTSRSCMAKLRTVRALGWGTANWAVIHGSILTWFSPGCLKPSKQGVLL